MRIAQTSDPYEWTSHVTVLFSFIWASLRIVIVLFILLNFITWSCTSLDCKYCVLHHHEPSTS
jgi:hypothetical protein